MNFGHDEKVEALRGKLSAFMADHILPNEHAWHEHTRSERRWRR